MGFDTNTVASQAAAAPSSRGETSSWHEPSAARVVESSPSAEGYVRPAHSKRRSDMFQAPQAVCPGRPATTSLKKGAPTQPKLLAEVSTIGCLQVSAGWAEPRPRAGLWGGDALLLRCWKLESFGLQGDVWN